MNVVFMGTPQFAVPCLQKLIENKYNVKCVVTQPDKPKGRGHKLAMPPVKECALDSSISVLQPDKIKNNTEFYNELKELAPDVIVVVAYGKILPPSILNIPKYGCINVHASLLPKYRGAAPIQWSIINGEKKTGITTMYMDEGMDTGDIIMKDEVAIEDDDTAETLHDKLSAAGAGTLLRTLKILNESGSLPREKQDHLQATYAPMIEKSMGEINWNNRAQDIRNLLRGLDPWPGAYTFLNEERIRVWNGSVEELQGDAGVVQSVGKEGMLVGTGEGCIRIREIQPENGRRMSIDEYARGHRIDIGQNLGRRHR